MSNIRKLIGADEIMKRISVMADEIERDYGGCSDIPQLVVTLNGSFIFAADLIRHLRLPVVVRFLVAKSYVGIESGPELTIYSIDNLKGIIGKDVLVVEDIVDTGKTLQGIYKYLRTFTPKSLRTVSLLSKPSRRQVLIDPDYTGFVIPDEFVVGYGLDYNDFYRGLPFIGVLTTN
jgi:hypoxanthine phosphoribosyltransferase